MRTSRFHALALVVLCLSGCGSKEEDARPCAPATSIACDCPGGGAGVQQCKDDGSGYAVCSGCSQGQDSAPLIDSGVDTTVDSTADALVDTAMDSTLDVSSEVAMDSGLDAPNDTTDSAVAPNDATVDSVIDAAVDGGPDVAHDADATVDAASDAGMDSTQDVAAEADVTPDAATTCNAGSLGTKRPLELCTSTGECVAGSECLTLNTAKVCVQCCDGRGTGPKASDCEIGTACVQNGAPVTPIPALANHCWFSECGGSNGAGTLMSPCEVGKDLWSVGAVGFALGQCTPTNDATLRGSCSPIGTLVAGTSCSASKLASTPQCEAGTICAGGASGLTCIRVCDPRVLPDECSETGKDCIDYSTYDGAVTGTFGLCAPARRCRLFDDAADCAGATVSFAGTQPAKCVPTTAARPNGQCSLPVGTAATSSACKNTSFTSLSDFCAAGLTCGGDASSSSNATCLAWCNLAGGAPTCTSGTCQPYRWSSSPIVEALVYGVCKL